MTTTKTGRLFIGAEVAVIRPCSAVKLESGLSPASMARFLIDRVIPEHPDGFTFDPIGNSFPTFTEHLYLVSQADRGMQFFSAPTQPEVESWLERNMELLCRFGNFIGGWLNPDDDIFHMDITNAVVGLNRALALGRKHRQVSIYYPFENASIVSAHENGPGCAHENGPTRCGSIGA